MALVGMPNGPRFSGRRGKLQHRAGNETIIARSQPANKFSPSHHPNRSLSVLGLIPVDSAPSQSQ